MLTPNITLEGRPASGIDWLIIVVTAVEDVFDMYGVGLFVAVDEAVNGAIDEPVDEAIDRVVDGVVVVVAKNEDKETSASR